jgi:16S rRNA (cytosine967-C5)-methyltransferase
MISPSRKVSYKLLRQISSDRVFSDDALNSEAVASLDIRDRHLTTEIVYGTLRWQETLDYLLTAATSRPWQEVDVRARILLRMSLYQMWQMDRIPDHALVNDAVEIAKREMGRGIDKYLNGILRHFSRTRPWAREDFLRGAPTWVRVSLPQWLWKRWSSRFGKSAATDYALSLNRPPQTAVRLDGNVLEELPFDASRSDLVPGAAIRISGPSNQDCSVHYQDEGSQLIPHLLGSIEGWRVWDACAAPGGKSVVLRNLCGKSGLIVASDLRRERVLRLADMLHQDGTKEPAVLVADVSKSAPFRCMFDAVLVDVPCSGLGTLRRNPEIKWRFDPGSGFQVLQQTQLQILDSVSDRVRLGGRLLYSTCSTEPEENEQVLDSFLRTHPGFGLERPDSPPGIENWIGDDGIVRTFPSIRLWDGFFAALMVRKK